MSLLAVDELMIREPRLLSPGLMPLGPVKIDSANPIAKGLKSFISVDAAGHLYDLTNAARPTADGATIITSATGRGAGYSGSNYTEFAGTTAYRISTDFTIAALVSFNAFSGYGHIAACQATITTNGWEVRAGNAATGSDLNVVRANTNYTQFRGSAGILNLGLNTLVVMVPADVNAEPTFVTKNSRGSLTVQYTATSGNIGATTGNLRLGKRIDSATNLSGGIYAIMLWHRQLAVAEAVSINSDFFQLLVPA